MRDAKFDATGCKADEGGSERQIQNTYGQIL